MVGSRVSNLCAKSSSDEVHCGELCCLDEAMKAPVLGSQKPHTSSLSRVASSFIQVCDLGRVPSPTKESDDLAVLGVDLSPSGKARTQLSEIFAQEIEKSIVSSSSGDEHQISGFTM